MTRDIDIPERDDRASADAIGRRNDLGAIATEAPEPQSRARNPSIGRDLCVLRSAQRSLKPCTTSAAFEPSRLDDLASPPVPGKRATQMRQDLRSLARTGTCRSARTVWTSAGSEQAGRGRAHQDRQGTPGTRGTRALRRRHVYAGFVKPAEVRARCRDLPDVPGRSGANRAGGGRIRRVVLDYELKQKVYSPLAKARALPPSGIRQAPGRNRPRKTD